MTQQMILRINDGGKPLCLYRYGAQSKVCDTLPINDWSDEQLRVDALTVLLPASWVYLTQTHIASKSKELLNKSIPFAIEEELSNEVDDNYYAFRMLSENQQSVAAIEKGLLNQLHQQIKQHELQVTAIYSEANWLPRATDKMYLWQEDESSLIRFGDDSAMRIANTQVAKMVAVFAANLKVLVTQEGTDFEGLKITVDHSLTAAMCCAAMNHADPINLYIDAIKNEQQNQQQQSLKPITYLAVLLLCSWVFIQGFQWFKLNQSIAELKNQQKNLFINNFPDAAQAELVDPFAALQSRLKLRGDSNNQQSNVLLEALQGIGAVLQQQPLIQINGLRMVDNKIELQINAPSMSAINAYHQALQLQAITFDVQIGVNELTDDNSFRSILTVVPR
ncbi:type II secretion system protein GspL [Marinicella sp. S1101]|uniref:type II secretion system protein GspL n=1 Tax=Marinicella marina TaxID=2996016 RepID=UPI002260E34B|nr:type II secretion system protein GspL [Marinicella marina]MCX7554786.1 type II secretion system protein GspL [Marinicella marina]MDJ1140981.1 type II secretion system protein GspL [Marinicella marina]